MSALMRRMVGRGRAIVPVVAAGRRAIVPGVSVAAVGCGVPVGWGGVITVGVSPPTAVPLTGADGGGVVAE